MAAFDRRLLQRAREARTALVADARPVAAITLSSDPALPVPTVALDQQIDLRTDGVPNRAHGLDDLALGVARDVRAPRPRERVEAA